MQVETNKPVSFGERFPHPNIHRSLLVATAGLAIASVIPGSSKAASLMLRSVAWLSSAAICADSWEKEDVYHRILNIGRIGVVTLAITGFVAMRPVLIVASLAAEVGLQTFEVLKAIHDKNPERCLAHLSVLVVDSLMLAAAVTGLWQVMVTAAAVNAFVMLIQTIAIMGNSQNQADAIDIICYVILAGTSVTAAIEAAKIVVKQRVTGHYQIKNEKDTAMEVFNSDKEKICSLQPGESVSLDYKYKPSQTKAMQGITHTKSGYPNKPVYIYPKKVDFKRVIVKNGLNPKEFTTLPVGGTIVVDRHQT